MRRESRADARVRLEIVLADCLGMQEVPGQAIASPWKLTQRALALKGREISPTFDLASFQDAVVS